MRYGSVNAMVRWLDRGETAAARERRFRNAVRKLTPKQRKFVLTVKRVVEVEKGPENLQAEKIMKRLKIGPRMYEMRLAEFRKTPPGDPYVEGR